MSLTSKIQALLTFANGITEAGDSTLGDAVKSLADGYGQGGASIAEGDITIDEDTLTLTINHNLNSSNVLVYVFGDTQNMGTYNTQGFLYIPLDGRVMSSNKCDYLFVSMENRSSWDYTMVGDRTGASGYSRTINDNSVSFKESSNFPFLAGTYHYIILNLNEE